MRWHPSRDLESRPFRRISRCPVPRLAPYSGHSRLIASGYDTATVRLCCHPRPMKVCSRTLSESSRAISASATPFRAVPKATTISPSSIRTAPLVSKKQITDDAAGFTALTQLLTDAGDTAENPIPVAIETPRGLMVATIRAAGRIVYAITRWPSPATANATPWPGRNPITPTR